MKTISSSGLLGLVMKIDDELKNGKSKDEVLSEYPVSKTALPFLLTLMRECSLIVSDMQKNYQELESENNTLKERIKLLENEKGFCDVLDTQNLENELKTLKNENNKLSKHIAKLEKENLDLKNEVMQLRFDLDESDLRLSRFDSFFESNVICSMFYKNYLRKYILGQGK